MIYEIYTENGTKKKRALTGNGYGLPLGTWISYEGTCPDGFIESEQSYNTSVYSALYAMLGSNTVPERFDHDRPSEWEEVVSTNTFTPNYDGVMIVGVTNTNLIVKVNDVEITRVETGQITDTSIPFKKGDVVTFFNLGGSAISKSFKVSYYKKHLAIKATPAYVEPDTVSDMVNTLRTQDSYSTSEVNTGKKWIDDKPIYRRTFEVYKNNVLNGWTRSGSTFIYQGNDLSIDELISNSAITSNSILTSWANGTDGADFSYGIKHSISGSNHVWNIINASDGQFSGTKCILTIEYTKTTD